MIYEKTIYFNTDDYIEEYGSTFGEEAREILLETNKLYTGITTNNLSSDEIIKLILKDFKFIEICNIHKLEKWPDYLYIEIAINLDYMTFKGLKYIADYFNADLVISHEDEEVFLYNGFYE